MTTDEENERLKRGIRQLQALMELATADATDKLSNLIKAKFKELAEELTR